MINVGLQLGLIIIWLGLRLVLWLGISVRVGVTDCCIQTADVDQSRDQNGPMAISDVRPWL